MPQMIRFILAVGTLVLAMSGRHVSAAVTLPEFDDAVSASVTDLSVLETDLADRLPDSGSAIPANDANLALNTIVGRLFETSRRSNFDNATQPPALLVRRDGSGSFTVRATFRDLNADPFDTGTASHIGIVSNESGITTPQVAPWGYSGLSTGISVPEPAAAVLLAVGIGMPLCLCRRRFN
jgi:hypothetical protein